jgi:WD40 repeat protein
MVKRISVDGGTPVTVARAGAAGTSISWRREGIVVGQGSQGILRISRDDVNPERILSMKDEGAFEPHLLPGGDAVLFTVAKSDAVDRWDWDSAKIAVLSLKDGRRNTLIDGSGARYLPSGHLVYAKGGMVLAVPFDVKQQKILGEAIPVLEGVRRIPNTGGPELSVSDTGTLIYVAGPATLSRRTRNLIITDRNGSTTPLPMPPGPYLHPRVSRDGKQLAVGIEDSQAANISLYDLSSPAAFRRLTFEGHNRFPVWSGDSQSIAFQSDREGDLGIFMQRSDGSSPAERLTKSEVGVAHIPESWSPDGRTLLFSASKDRTFSLWTLSLDTRKITRFGNMESRMQFGATFSPDGRWVAYMLFKRGSEASPLDNGVYVQPFPATGLSYQVPKESFDFHPVWGTSSAELFYIPSQNRLSMVPVRTQSKLTFGKAVTLPKPATHDRLNDEVRDYDVMPDGRFLSSVPAADENVSGPDAAPQIRVVLNWFEELKQRVPIK